MKALSLQMYRREANYAVMRLLFAVAPAVEALPTVMKSAKGFHSRSIHGGLHALLLNVWMKKSVSDSTATRILESMAAVVCISARATVAKLM